MVGKIMKAKALTSYDQLLLATKSRSDCGPVPNLFKNPDTIEFHVCIPPRRGSPMPDQAKGLGNVYTNTT